MAPAKSAKKMMLFLEKLVWPSRMRYKGKLAERLGNSSIRTLLPIRSVTRVRAKTATIIKAFVTLQLVRDGLQKPCGPFQCGGCWNILRGQARLLRSYLHER